MRNLLSNVAMTKFYKQRCYMLQIKRELIFVIKEKASSGCHKTSKAAQPFLKIRISKWLRKTGNQILIRPSFPTELNRLISLCILRRKNNLRLAPLATYGNPAPTYQWKTTRTLLDDQLSNASNTTENTNSVKLPSKFT